MLVLSRQRDQTIMIGDEVEISVVDIRGDKVRLGIKAPRTVSVHRKEVYEAIKKANQEAARLTPDDLVRVSGKPEDALNSIESRATHQIRNNQCTDPFLRAAIDEAKLGLQEGGLPIGSVLVREGVIIGRGHNRRVQQNDPMAHAEIDCLKNAGRQKTYKDTILYSTLMPCFLCTGAIIQFGIPRVIAGESVTFAGGTCRTGTSPAFMKQNSIEVIDLHDPECIEMMSTFIKNNPGLWNEDIGVE